MSEEYSPQHRAPAPPIVAPVDVLDRPFNADHPLYLDGGGAFNASMNVIARVGLAISRVERWRRGGTRFAESNEEVVARMQTKVEKSRRDGDERTRIAELGYLAVNQKPEDLLKFYTAKETYHNRRALEFGERVAKHATKDSFRSRRAERKQARHTKKAQNAAGKILELTLQ